MPAGYKTCVISEATQRADMAEVSMRDADNDRKRSAVEEEEEEDEAPRQRTVLRLTQCGWCRTLFPTCHAVDLDGLVPPEWTPHLHRYETLACAVSSVEYVFGGHPWLPYVSRRLRFVAVDPAPPLGEQLEAASPLRAVVSRDACAHAM